MAPPVQPRWKRGTRSVDALRGMSASSGGGMRWPQGRTGWPLAYALAWLSVAGGNSVMPPWVRHQFPEAGAVVRHLRDVPCADSGCVWCRERHDAGKELKRWFGFDGFRAKPATEAGQSMQQMIVEVAMDRGPCARPAAHRRRQVALLPGSRAFPVRQDRRAHGGHLAAGRSHGGSGRGPRGPGYRFVRHGERHVVHAGARRRARPGALGRRRHCADIAGTIAQPLAATHARTAGDWRLGARRGALLVALGPRFSSRLPLCGTLHPRTGGRFRATACDVSDRDGEARRGGGHPGLLSRTARASSS